MFLNPFTGDLYAPEIVTAATDAGRFTQWKSVVIHAAVNEACRSFTLEVAADALEAASVFRDFMPVSILAGNDLLVTGYIDRRRPKLSPTAASRTISGRSKGQDAVDCSAHHDTGRFEGKHALGIAQELDVYDIGFSCDAELEPLDYYQVTPGGSLHREVERLCRDEFLSPFGQADGSIKLWNADTSLKRQTGAIVEGVNLHEGEADHNCANRHSHTHVRGQGGKGTGRDVHQYESIAEDKGVPRTRRIHHHHDGHVDKRRVKNRAAHRRDRAAGNGLRASIKMVGWRDEGGMLWTPGNRVWVESPFLDIAQDMLIERVSYHQDAGAGDGDGGSGGTKAHLELVDPRAYKGKGSSAAQSGSQWNIDESDAS